MKAKILGSFGLLLMFFAVLAMPLARAADRQGVQDARSGWDQSKSDYDAAKEALENARKGNQTRNDTTQLLDLKKTLLLKLVDRVEAHIELVKAWANKMKIDDNTKAQIIKTLDDEKAKLEAEKSVISGITTTADLKTEAKKIRDVVQDVRHAVKIVVAQMLGQRTNNIIDRANKLSAKLDSKLAELKAKGVDTSKAQSLVDQFKAKIASAQDLANQANAKFVSALSNPETAEQTVKDGRDLLKQSHQALKDAHDLLKQIIKSLRGLKVKPEDVGAAGEEQ